MTTSNESFSNFSTEDGLEIKFVGKRIKKHVGNPRRNCPRPRRRGYNWSFSSSGRYCAQFKSLSDKGIDNSFFTVVDLVDRISFETKIAYEQETDDELEFVTFYFTADDELVIISGFHELVKQLVYRINYDEYKVELQDTITHTLLTRDVVSPYIAVQSHNFVSYNGTDYVVLITYGDDKVIANNEVCIYTIYFVPRDPADKNKPLKEYQIHLKKEDIFNVEEMVNQNENFSFNERKEVIVDVSSCLIDGTKLLLSYDLFGYTRWERQRIRSYDATLIGAKLVVDLTKLTDISTKQLDSTDQIQQLMNEQDSCYSFAKRGELRIGTTVHLQCCDKDIGVVCIFNHGFSEATPSALVYPKNMTESSEPIKLNCKIESEYDKHHYLLHPGGALLHCDFAKRRHIRLRVLNCLKPNLMLLAMNRALFYKNIIIKDHPVYRLCLRECFKYNVISPKKGRKRKLTKS